MNGQDALKNQALYWRGFAYLAVHGKRELKDWQAMMMTSVYTPPTDDDVAQILNEAKEVMDSKGEKAA